MRVALRFARDWPAIPGLLTALAVLAILAAPGWSRAQTPGESTAGHAQSRYLAEEDRSVDSNTAFLHLATRYTETVIVGLVVGGLVLNQLIGGTRATMIGTVAGTVIACWVYLRQAETRYVVREVR